MFLFAKVHDNCAPMTMPWQVDERDILNRDPRRRENDVPMKPVALVTPPPGRIRMHTAQASPGLNIGKIEDTGKRRLFFIRLLQHEDVARLRKHVRAQDISRATGIDDPVFTAAPMYVPVGDGQVCMRSFHRSEQAVLPKVAL